MKKCSYCGRESPDEAANCYECGTEFENETAKSDKQTVQTPEKKTLVIRVFPNCELAEMAVAKLKAHGIESWLATDDCAGMYPSLTIAEGVRLLVWAEECAIAAAVLDAKPTPEESKKIEIEAVLAPPPPSESKRKLAWGQLLLAFAVGVLVSLLYQWKQDQAPVTHYEYNQDGKRTDAWIYKNGHLMEHMEDRNLDGQWDHWAHYQHGIVVRSEYDNNFNGVPDLFGSYKYRIVQKVEVRPNGSKFATKREYYKNGVLSEIWSGGDSNGIFREVIKYDPFMNPVSTNTP